jgi:hypothetical protein
LHCEECFETKFFRPFHEYPSTSVKVSPVFLKPLCRRWGIGRLGDANLHRIADKPAVWARNLLFIGLCLAGLAALGASLSPVHKPMLRSDLRTVTSAAQGFGATVERLNAAFRDDWKARGIKPVGQADDLAIARRLSLALVGTVPSLEEIRLFEEQPAGRRLEWWLAGIFADRRHHDYLAERLARAYVGTQDGPFIIYRRRRFVSWLADELSENRPYDRIVTRLISDSGLWTDQPATNFVTVTVKPDQGKGPDANELAARVSRAFLGIRIDCAECHDHPFEGWKQSDFRGLAAFFGGTKQTFTGIHDVAGAYEVEDPATGQSQTIAPCVPFQPDLLPPDGSQLHLDGSRGARPGERSWRAKLAAWVTSRENKAFARAAVNRIWAQMFGRPLIEPIDDIHPDGELPAALDILADDFVEHGYDLRRLIALIAASEAFGRDSRDEEASGGTAISGTAISGTTISGTTISGTTISGTGSGEAITPAHEESWAVFPIVRLRPEQVIGSLLQAASLETIDYQSHIVVRFFRATQQNDFVREYGDAGEDEFSPANGTIPQRLLMMNGQQVLDRTKDDLVANASTRIAMLAPNDAKAVETAYLAVLTRRPSADEAAHFEAALGDTYDKRNRNQRMEDLYWTLLNSTEFAWNH